MAELYGQKENESMEKIAALENKIREQE